MSDATTKPVTIRYASGPTETGIAVITMDDGKANALGHDMISALLTAMDEVEAAGADALVIVGRPGRFSAGFDLAVMKGDAGEARDMLAAGVDLFLRIFQFPRPVVVACTGHAIAAGAIILMSSDIRIGTAGEFKIGMPELTIGMPLPSFATELMRDRLSKRHLTQATLGQMYDPERAIDAGFLDEVVPEGVLDTAIDRAWQVGDVSSGPLKRTRITARGNVANTIRLGLVEDLSHFTVES
ncbi:MAG: crotonase/enoyl-CoA hydratase family protein [Acidimicrobiales bacterium]|nr:crotonase/enoyl-CoA hydratase family protein [Acidimicrobiales bacterium]